MIDLRRPNRRIAVAIGVSLVINGLQFAGIRRLVSATASPQEVRIAVQLQPGTLAVSLPPRPKRVEKTSEPPIPATGAMNPAPLTTVKPVSAGKANSQPAQIAALPAEHRRYKLTEAAPGAPVVRYPLAIPSGVGTVPGSAGDNVGESGAQPGVAVGGSGTPAGIGSPGEPARAESPAPARPVEVRPSPQPSVEEPRRVVVPAVIHAENRGAKAIATPQPPYPRDARTEGVEGEVTLSVSLDARGNVTEVDVAKSSGDRRLDRAAERGVRSWRFEPALEDGRPAASVVRVKVRFSLN